MERKLGTFLGVYTPTVLTILGVIMYLRFGWLVGQLGLQQILMIVLLANAITIITTLSFSAVATNTHLGAGGAYYIISRSLGIEIGGAIGLPLFLSQASSVTLYCFGLAESLRFVWSGLPLQLVALALILLVGVIAYLGAEQALKSQIPLMILVALSMVALTVGALTRSAAQPLIAGPPTGTLRFWPGFAIFFPAVTGIMAGLGLSGDLKDPGRAIPLGALTAVGTGLVVYLLVPVLLTMGASPAELRDEPLIWTKIAPLGPLLVLPGLWAAIFSSAVGSILGAPRTLQALARDGLAPGFLGRRGAERRNLLPALLVSVAIALAAVYLGDLNAVATVVTLFFLTVYGTTNLVAAFEALSGDPSWRPRLRVPWPVNLLGGLACVAVMFLINPVVGIIAIVAEGTLWLALSRREHAARWGDARRGLYENLIRWALIKLAEHPVSSRNWRPHVLVFVDDPIRELDLVRFGNWFSQGRGVVTVCQLVVGDLLQDDLNLQAERQRMQEALDTEKLVVFAEVDVAGDLVEGIVDVAQANGMAGIASNTVLLGWPRETGLQIDFLKVLPKLERLRKSLIIGRIQPRHLYPREGIARTVHVWWGGLQRNSDLMLLLAYLLTRNPEWRGAHVKVLSIATSELMKEQTERYLAKLIPEIRIEAEVEVLLKSKEESVSALIHKQSRDAEVVFLGLATPPPGQEAEYADRLEKLAGDLPTVFFVKNASMFMGDLLGAEEEKAAPPLPEQKEMPRSQSPGGP
jgi:potassium/chloride transporter 4/5/6